MESVESLDDGGSLKTLQTLSINPSAAAPVASKKTPSKPFVVKGSPARSSAPVVKEEQPDFSVDFLLRAPYFWPAGLVKAVKQSKNVVAQRYCLIDNSQSMLTVDPAAPCSRWEDVLRAVTLLAKIAAAAQVPTQLMLLNSSKVVDIAPSKKDGTSAGGEAAGDPHLKLSEVDALLQQAPAGQSHLCRLIGTVLGKVKGMEKQLRDARRVAVITVFTDGEATDGDLVAVLKGLEPLPVKLCVRLCTDDENVRAHWRELVGQVDVDLTLLDRLETEADDVLRCNSWLTYGEPLHRAREFGLGGLAVFDTLRDRQLPKNQVKAVVDAVLTADRKVLLPNPDVASWPEFVKAVNKLVDTAPETACPVRRVPAPWVDMGALGAYVPDPITLIVDANEDLLWRVFVFYALNSTHVDRTDFAPHNRHAAGPHGTPHSPHPPLVAASTAASAGARPPLRPEPTFRTALSKLHRRLLKQDHLWLLLNDFGLVPAIINTVRFAKLMADIVQPRAAAKLAAAPKAKVRALPSPHTLPLVLSSSQRTPPPSITIDLWPGELSPVHSGPPQHRRLRFPLVGTRQPRRAAALRDGAHGPPAPRRGGRGVLRLRGHRGGRRAGPARARHHGGRRVHGRAAGEPHERRARGGRGAGAGPGPGPAPPAARRQWQRRRRRRGGGERRVVHGVAVAVAVAHARVPRPHGGGEQKPPTQGKPRNQPRRRWGQRAPPPPAPLAVHDQVPAPAGPHVGRRHLGGLRVQQREPRQPPVRLPDPCAGRRRHAPIYGPPRPRHLLHHPPQRPGRTRDRHAAFRHGRLRARVSGHRGVVLLVVRVPGRPLLLLLVL